jgi:hypothetical protein
MSIGLFSSCLKVISSKGKVFALFNLLFFGGVLVVVLTAQFLFPPPLFLGWFPMVPNVFVWKGFMLAFGIFLFNLIVSAFVVVTLPGFAFFPLSAAFLLYRAVLRGLFLYSVPTWLFLVALPTIVLEGEAHVFAAVGGTIVGISWIKLKWLYSTEGLSRGDAFKPGVRECLRLYVIVALLLFVAAVAETIVILSYGFAV